MDNRPLANLRGLILDMDGVLWRDTEPIGDLPAIFQAIQQRGLGVVLATNNATRSASQFQEKMRRFGVELQEWQIVTSSQATAAYLQRRFPAGGNVYIIGEEGLRNALQTAGFQHTEQQPLAVVVGLDRELTYTKLRQAALLIRTGIPFIGTNPDRTLPTPEGFIPGSGSLLAALQAATDVSPTLIGKPAPEMYLLALERLGTNPAATLVVGDRLETDIAGAQPLGCPTALVLSGATSAAEGHSWQPAPDLIAADLAAVIASIVQE